MTLKLFSRFSSKANEKHNLKNKSKKEIGDYGEKLAVKFLKKQGYKILSTNYKVKYGEIDIIAKDGLFTVFIEVKYRSKKLYGLPSEAVDKHKQNKIKYILTNSVDYKDANEALINDEEGFKFFVNNIIKQAMRKVNQEEMC